MKPANKTSKTFTAAVSTHAHTHANTGKDDENVSEQRDFTENTHTSLFFRELQHKN
jgi:hypothetical protein